MAANEEVKLNIYQRLSVVRKAHRLTPGGMAAILGVPRKAYLDLEAAQTDLTATAMMRLVEHLCVSPLWLLTGRGASECDPDFIYETCVDRISALEEKMIALGEFNQMLLASIKAMEANNKTVVRPSVAVKNVDQISLFDLSIEQRGQVCKAYESGMKIGKIVLTYKVSRSTILAILGDKSLHKIRAPFPSVSDDSKASPSRQE